MNRFNANPSATSEAPLGAFSELPRRREIWLFDNAGRYVFEVLWFQFEHINIVDKGYSDDMPLEIGVEPIEPRIQYRYTWEEVRTSERTKLDTALTLHDAARVAIVEVIKLTDYISSVTDSCVCIDVVIETDWLNAKYNAYFRYEFVKLSSSFRLAADTETAYKVKADRLKDILTLRDRGPNKHAEVYDILRAESYALGLSSRLNVKVIVRDNVAFLSRVDNNYDFMLTRDHVFVGRIIPYPRWIAQDLIILSENKATYPYVLQSIISTHDYNRAFMPIRVVERCSLATNMIQTVKLLNKDFIKTLSNSKVVYSYVLYDGLNANAAFTLIAPGTFAKTIIVNEKYILNIKQIYNY